MRLPVSVNTSLAGVWPGNMLMTRLMWARAGWLFDGTRSHRTFPSRTWTPGRPCRSGADGSGPGPPPLWWPVRERTSSQRICGGFSSRTESLPWISTALPSPRSRPYFSRVREKHSSSMEAVSSSTVA